MVFSTLCFSAIIKLMFLWTLICKHVDVHFLLMHTPSTVTAVIISPYSASSESWCSWRCVSNHVHKRPLQHVSLICASVFLGISWQKPVVRIEILPGQLGSCSPIPNFPCLCAILIVCHFCLQTRLWSARVRPMETWGGAAPSLSSRDRFPALASLPGVCVTCLIKVALVSPSPRFVWVPS